jgi:hypothetical protein
MITPTLRRTVFLAAAGLLLALLPVTPGVADPGPAGSTAPTSAAASAAPDCAELDRRDAAGVSAGRSGTTTCVRRMAPTSGVGTGPSLNASIPCGTTGWAYTRFTACYQADYRYEIRTYPPERLLIGYINFTVVIASSVHSKSLEWESSIDFIGRGQAGVTDGTYLYLETLCNLNCSRVTAAPERSRPFTGGSRVTVAAGFSTPYLGAEAQWRASAGWLYYFYNQKTSPPFSNAVATSPPDHRCDDQLGIPIAPGCVYDAVTPEYLVSRLNPKYHRHIQLAINFGVTSSLTRHRTPAISDANSRVACPPQPNPPADQQCDEYPFASTLEGAASQPFGTTFFFSGGINGGGETFACGVNWVPLRRTVTPGGYSVCYIPSSDNSGGGAELGKFYSDYRVVPRDRFTVRPV